jgi:hypothetical protein
VQWPCECQPWATCTALGHVQWPCECQPCECQPCECQPCECQPWARALNYTKLWLQVKEGDSSDAFKMRKRML